METARGRVVLMGIIVAAAEWKWLEIELLGLHLLRL